MKEATLNNSMLNKMRMNPQLVARFTFLTMTMSQQGGCCRKSKIVPDFEGMKRAIVALPPDQREVLKQATGFVKLNVLVQQGAKVETVSI